MAFATFTANGQTDTIVGAFATLPQWGIWSARVDLDRGDILMSGACSIALGNLVLKGTIRRGGIYAAGASYFVFGGADGWSLDVPPTSYRGSLTFLSTAVRDAAALVGETVVMEPGAERQIGTFARFGGPASRVLAALSPQNWWVETDGTTHVGARTSTAAPAVQVINYDQDQRTITFSDEDQVVLPGQTLSAGSLSGVISTLKVTIVDSVLRTEAWIQ